MSEDRYEDFYNMGADFAQKFEALVEERYGIESDEDLDAFFDGFFDSF